MEEEAVEPFLLIVSDLDRGLFSIEGPMVDDRTWIERVCEAQQGGRRVRCSTAGPGTRDEVAERYSRSTGLLCSSEPVLTRLC